MVGGWGVAAIGVEMGGCRRCGGELKGEVSGGCLGGGVLSVRLAKEEMRLHSHSHEGSVDPRQYIK